MRLYNQQSLVRESEFINANREASGLIATQIGYILQQSEEIVYGLFQVVYQLDVKLNNGGYIHLMIDVLYMFDNNQERPELMNLVEYANAALGEIVKLIKQEFYKNDMPLFPNQPPWLRDNSQEVMQEIAIQIEKVFPAQRNR